MKTPSISSRILGWYGKPGDILKSLFPSLQEYTASVLREYKMVWIKKFQCWEENPNLKFPNDSLDIECQILSLSCCATESQEKLKLNKETFHDISGNPNQEIYSGWGPLNQELLAMPWIGQCQTLPHHIHTHVRLTGCASPLLIWKKGPEEEGASLTCRIYEIIIFSLTLCV